MPAPMVNLPTPSPAAPVSFSLEPGYNAFNSLALLNRADTWYGLDDWVTRTVAALPAERRRWHEIIFVGLYYAIEPARSFASFGAYVNDLSRQSPAALRDRLFDAYARQSICAPTARPAPVEVTTLLANRRTFLKYLRERFTPEHVIEAVEVEAHALLNDPPKMKDAIVEHLQAMSSIVAPEWTRVTPMLQACIDAYRQIDFSHLSILEAAERIVGHELDEDWRQKLATTERIVCVPSAHLGPYLMKFNTPRALIMLFGARQPQGVTPLSPDLSRSELLTRLLALADDTRLRILHLIAQHGELCSPDIIHELDLSQSAASRHLQQLTATGYLIERRREGAKCYSLSADRVDDTFRALSRFLQHKSS